jgi:regulator of sigma E protease
VKDWEEMSGFVHKHPDEVLEFSVLRNDKDILEFKIKTVRDPAYKIGLIGVAPKILAEKVGILQSMNFGVKMVVKQSWFTLKYLGEKIVKWEKPELSGPIGVVQILAKAAKAGIENLLYLLAVISTALGLFNLLPIPMLDGGHIFIALIEGLVRKPLGKKAIYAANSVGFVIIISIFLFATYNDLLRIGLFKGKI